MKFPSLIFIIFPIIINGNFPDEKAEFCKNLDCEDEGGDQVCGIRIEGEDKQFKVFENECELLQYGCQVAGDETYGITKMKYCQDPGLAEHVKFVSTCPYNCSLEIDQPICAIRKHGDGFKIRKFNNKCLLQKYNCLNKPNGIVFNATDYFICEKDDEDQTSTENETVEERESTTPSTKVAKKNKPIKGSVVIVDARKFDKRNITESINKFIASTHVSSLPLRDIQGVVNDTTRRMLIKTFGPLKMFVPWIERPNNITEQEWETNPTVKTCYHKCPKECPEEYHPICGVPALLDRPSVAFKNHCLMDMAQCTLNPQDKLVEYQQTSFIFCIGDEMNNAFRFLPIIKTLQRMGRIKKRGKFQYKFNNLKFLNNFLAEQLSPMG